MGLSFKYFEVCQSYRDDQNKDDTMKKRRGRKMYLGGGRGDRGEKERGEKEKGERGEREREKEKGEGVKGTVEEEMSRLSRSAQSSFSNVDKKSFTKMKSGCIFTFSLTHTHTHIHTSHLFHFHKHFYSSISEIFSGIIRPLNISSSLLPFSLEFILSPSQLESSHKAAIRRNKHSPRFGWGSESTFPTFKW